MATLSVNGLRWLSSVSPDNDEWATWLKEYGYDEMDNEMDDDDGDDDDDDENNFLRLCLFLNISKN